MLTPAVPKPPKPPTASYKLNLPGLTKNVLRQARDLVFPCMEKWVCYEVPTSRHNAAARAKHGDHLTLSRSDVDFAGLSSITRNTITKCRILPSPNAAPWHFCAPSYGTRSYSSIVMDTSSMFNCCAASFRIEFTNTIAYSASLLFPVALGISEGLDSSGMEFTAK